MLQTKKKKRNTEQCVYCIIALGFVYHSAWTVSLCSVRLRICMEEY